VEQTDEPPFEMQITESLHVTLANSARPDDLWLWCIYCERFFQARHVRVDYLGNRQGCAFCECAGFDVALFLWDTFREPDDPDWPASEAHLRHGLKLYEETA